jgi:UDP-4-amino-4,6-dideoxy-N-acetyl-beta-L-altrosamine transaminase
MIPYGRQEITQADIDEVVKVLNSDFLTQGPAVPRFERAVTACCGALHGVAVNSATSALHVACQALGLGPGDVLWTVPNTFVASANCGLYCGAKVDFVDIDPRTWDMSVPALRAKLVLAKHSGNLPKVVIPVHFGGQPTEQEEIWALAQEFGFKVLEDASHSIGASRNGEPVGSCRWSHVSVFSFHPVKIITTAEGGMALANDEELAWRMALLRSHGITRDPARMHRDPEGPWYYEQLYLGYNYRMTDLQAALGLSQLERLGNFIERRNFLAKRYDQLLAGLPLQLPTIRPGNRSSFHLYGVRLTGDAIRKSRRDVFESLRDQGIGVNLHYMPVHLQPYYRDQGFSAGLCPEAEKHAQEAITLPLYPAVTEAEQDRVVEVLAGALE